MESAKPERNGTLVVTAVAMPVELYSPRRRAEFMLNNAVDAAEYKRALRAVRKLGINPGDIPHRKP